MRAEVCRPDVPSLVALGKRLSNVRLILLLFDVIETSSDAIEVLSLDHLVDMVTACNLLAIREGLRHIRLVIEEPWVDLLHSRLILHRLPILAKMRWCAWAVDLSGRVEALTHGVRGACGDSSWSVQHSSNLIS